MRCFSPIERLSNAFFVAMHASALFVLVVPVSWKVLGLALAGYLVRMWAITAGYHRYFAHRAYRTSRPWQLFMAVLGSSTMQNGPIWWASVHRKHHKESDGPRDLHSPLRRGFWYAHVGWVFDLTVPRPRDDSNVRDLLSFPELRWVDQHDWVPLIGYAAICLAIGGIPGLVWGFVVSTLAVFHATMLINSLAHISGSRPYATHDESRNNPLLAAITLGEGWHNNHHFYMSSARQGFRWWEIDVSYYTLRVLSWLHVVWALREPPAAVLTARLAAATVPGAVRR